MEKLAHQNVPVPRVIIIAAYLILVGQATPLLFSDDTVDWLAMEDGPIENIGALSFLLASGVFFMTAFRSSRLHGQSGANHFESPLSLLALGGLCFICFGEEISWGQRLFDYSVPVWLEGINRQGEWNLHNLAWFHAKTAEGVEKSFWARLFVMDRLLATFQLVLCMFVPILTDYSALLRTWAARIGLPIVPWWIAGLVPTHILITQGLYAIGAEDPIMGNALDETKESARAFIFFMVAGWAYRLTTSKSFAAIGQRPFDRGQTPPVTLSK